MSEFTIPIIGNLLESIAAEFKDRVKPVPGSVLRVDLCGGANFLGGRICHTGIYLGNDEIAEITNVRGKARAHVVDPSDFLNGQGTNFIRTGLNIYVATDGCGRALAAPEIAERARGCFGPPGGRPLPARAGEYDLVDNNCHTFVVRCVTGREPSRPKLNDRDVAAALKRVFKCERVTWEPTGFSTVSCSFDDEDG
jgi:hypothetical protein